MGLASAPRQQPTSVSGPAGPPPTPTPATACRPPQPPRSPVRLPPTLTRCGTALKAHPTRLRRRSDHHWAEVVAACSDAACRGRIATSPNTVRGETKRRCAKFAKMWLVRTGARFPKWWRGQWRSGGPNGGHVPCGYSSVAPHVGYDHDQPHLLDRSGPPSRGSVSTETR